MDHNSIDLVDYQQRQKRAGLNIQILFGGMNVHWFICFGTLLNFLRDKTLDINSDIDIGVITDDINSVVNTVSAQHRINHFIKSDDTGQYLNFQYFDEQNQVAVDIFNWVQFKGMYWHTYDTYMEFPKKGIPSRYIFKSMPKEVFDKDKKKIVKYSEDLKYGNINHFGPWVQPIPDFPTEGIVLQVPHNYGYFMDIAYPDWFTTRTQFGVSEGFSYHETKSCKGLC